MRGHQYLFPSILSFLMIAVATCIEHSKPGIGLSVSPAWSHLAGEEMEAQEGEVNGHAQLAGHAH